MSTFSSCLRYGHAVCPKSATLSPVTRSTGCALGRQRDDALASLARSQTFVQRRSDDDGATQRRRRARSCIHQTARVRPPLRASVTSMQGPLAPAIAHERVVFGHVDLLIEDGGTRHIGLFFPASGFAWPTALSPAMVSSLLRQASCIERRRAPAAPIASRELRQLPAYAHSNGAVELACAAPFSPELGPGSFGRLGPLLATALKL